METPKRLGRRILAMVVVGWLLFICLDFVLTRCCGVPPRASTRNSMWRIKCRIIRYAKQHGELPTSLDHLPQLGGDPRANATTDWWGNRIHYAVDRDGLVTLSSNGGRVWGFKAREGKPLVRTFRARTPDGEWAKENVQFIEDLTRQRRQYMEFQKEQGCERD